MTCRANHKAYRTSLVRALSLAAAAALMFAVAPLRAEDQPAVGDAPPMIAAPAVTEPATTASTGTP